MQFQPDKFRQNNEEKRDKLAVFFEIFRDALQYGLNLTDDIESLRSKPQPGHPARLTKEQKNELKAVLQQIPEKHSISGKVWNGRNLSCFLDGWLLVN